MLGTGEIAVGGGGLVGSEEEERTLDLLGRQVQEGKKVTLLTTDERFDRAVGEIMIKRKAQVQQLEEGRARGQVDT